MHPCCIAMQFIGTSYKVSDAGKDRWAVGHQATSCKGSTMIVMTIMIMLIRGGICHSRHCRRQCKIFASGVNFSIFTQFLCLFLLKLFKLGEISGVKFFNLKIRRCKIFDKFHVWCWWWWWWRWVRINGHLAVRGRWRVAPWEVFPWVEEWRGARQLLHHLRPPSATTQSSANHWRTDTNWHSSKNTSPQRLDILTI